MHQAEPQAASGGGQQPERSTASFGRPARRPGRSSARAGLRLAWLRARRRVRGLFAEPWQRNLFALYSAAFLASTGFSFVNPLIPLFLKDLLSSDPQAVGFWSGLAFGISPLLTAITAPWWGAIGDRVGQKLMVQRALVAIGLATALFAIVRGPADMVALRAVIGALGGISVATLAAVSTTAPRHRVAAAIGTLQAMQWLGAVAGPGLGGLLGDLLGIRSAFVVAAALFAAGLVVVSALFAPAPASAPAEPPVERDPQRPRAFRLAGLRTLAATPSLPFVLLALFTASFVDSGLMLLLPLLIGPLGAPPGQVATLAGLAISAGALAVTVASLTVGRLAARQGTPARPESCWGPRRPLAVLALAFGLGALLVVPLLLATTWWQLIAFRFLLGLATGAAPTLCYAAVALAVPRERQGAVLGLVSTAALLGWATAPAVSGLLLGIGPQVILLVDLALYGGNALALVWWLRRGALSGS